VTDVAPFALVLSEAASSWIVLSESVAGESGALHMAAVQGSWSSRVGKTSAASEASGRRGSGHVDHAVGMLRRPARLIGKCDRWEDRVSAFGRWMP
jgi:hypothetical protein